VSETSNSNVSVVADKSVDINDNEKDRKSEEVNSKKSKKKNLYFFLLWKKPTKSHSHKAFWVNLLTLSFKVEDNFLSVLSKYLAFKRVK
jgi:hypothetical protein